MEMSLFMTEDWAKIYDELKHNNPLYLDEMRSDENV